MTSKKNKCQSYENEAVFRTGYLTEKTHTTYHNPPRKLRSVFGVDFRPVRRDYSSSTTPTAQAITLAMSLEALLVISPVVFGMRLSELPRFPVLVFPRSTSPQ